MESTIPSSRPVHFLSMSAMIAVLLLCLHCTEGRKHSAYAFRGFSLPSHGHAVGVTSQFVRADDNVGLLCGAESENLYYKCDKYSKTIWPYEKLMTGRWTLWSYQAIRTITLITEANLSGSRKTRVLNMSNSSSCSVGVHPPGNFGLKV